MSIDSMYLYLLHEKVSCTRTFFLENCDYVDDIMTSAVTPIFTK